MVTAPVEVVVQAVRVKRPMPVVRTVPEMAESVPRLCGC
jgi:hypothetical protein